jgi:aspartate/methionine/tyrosine aminotransferase
MSFVDDMRAQYAVRRDAVARGLNAIDGINCPSPEGTFYAFASFDETWGDSRDLASYLLEHAGVLLTPGSAYGPASRHHIRLSFATDLATIEEGIARINDALPPPAQLTSND